MTAVEKIQRGYVITVRGAGDAEAYQVSYVPRGLQQNKPSSKTKRMPEYVAAVDVNHEKVTWDQSPPDPELAQKDFDADVIRRVRLQREWQTSPGRGAG